MMFSYHKKRDLPADIPNNTANAMKDSKLKQNGQSIIHTPVTNTKLLQRNVRFTNFKSAINPISNLLTVLINPTI